MFRHAKAVTTAGLPKLKPLTNKRKPFKAPVSHRPAKKGRKTGPHHQAQINGLLRFHNPFRQSLKALVDKEKHASFNTLFRRCGVLTQLWEQLF